MSHEQSWLSDLPSSDFWPPDRFVPEESRLARQQQWPHPFPSLSSSPRQQQYHHHRQQPSHPLPLPSASLPHAAPSDFHRGAGQDQFALNYIYPHQSTPSASLHAALREGADFLPRSSTLPRLPQLPRHQTSSSNQSSFGYIPSHFFYSPPQSPQDPVPSTQPEILHAQPITQESVRRSISDHAFTTFTNSNPAEHLSEPSTTYQTYSQPPNSLHTSIAGSSTMPIPTPSTSSAARKRQRPSPSHDSGPSPTRRRIDPTITHIDLSDSDENDDINETPEDQNILDREREELVNRQHEESSKMSRIGELNCMICLEHFTNMTATACGHIFCHECLTQALTHSQRNSDRNHGTCPACRKPVRPDKKNQVVPLALMTARKRK